MALRQEIIIGSYKFNNLGASLRNNHNEFNVCLKRLRMGISGKGGITGRCDLVQSGERAGVSCAGTPTRHLPARGCNRSGVNARYTANVQIEYFDELFAP
jgi:hypothetical protein